MLKTILLSGLVMLMMSTCNSTPNSSQPKDTSGQGSSTVEVPPDTSPDGPELEEFESKAISFSPNDVSILFPAPKTPTELNANILRLTDFQPDRVLPENVFRQVMALITGPSTLTTPNGALTVDAGAIPGTGRRINFPGQNLRSDWVVAGIRIDPGAPGMGENIFNVFGKSPQIRLILQPVSQSNNGLRDLIDVTDGSLHLVYAFHGPDDPVAKSQCFLHNVADMESFQTAVTDLKAIKDRFETEHGVVTDGLPLGVHPAVSVAGAEFRGAIQSYLNTYLTPERLFAVSVAGIPLPNPEPWVFLAMQKSPLSGNIEAVPGPAIVQAGPLPNFGQMISFIDRPQIVPAPATDNLQAVNCNINRTGRVPQPVAGAGLSTATVFDQGDRNITQIASVIADVTQSHFFNTDCISCHTETRKEIDMGQTTAAIIGVQANIDPAVIPGEQWNVRAFGWFPGFFNQLESGAHETVTRRTAHETAEVIKCFETDNWHRADVACLH